MLRLLVLMIFCANLANAQNIKSQRPPVKNQSGIQLRYQQTQWNKDSKKIDSGFLVIKDADSNKSVIIQLQESDPDSSIFTGTYRIQISNAQNYTPSIYIPNQEELTKEDSKKLFLQNIKEAKVSRKPFLLKREGSLQTIEIFDTKKQAQLALESYRKQRAIFKTEKVLKDQELTEEEQLEKASNLALKKQLLRFKNEAIARDKERKQRLQQELEKLEILRKKFTALTAEEKLKSQAESSKTLQQAFSLFNENNFNMADPLFWSALEKDPYNAKNIYSYAVNLFRREDYNNAILYFYLSDSAEIDSTEKNYYIASSHYKLIELNYAEEIFNKIKIAANKNLSASAAFYLGLIQYQRENFSPAKTEFEFVLDHSIDPALDHQAELYIEKIQQDLQFVNAQKKPYTANLSLGLLYDSNILLQSDGTSASAVASEDGGLRYQMMGSLEYRPIYTRQKEWSIKGIFAYLYSFDDEFSQADPLDLIISSPYKKSSQAFGKSYRWELEPGIELLYMDVDQQGDRENILNAVFLNWKNSFVMNEKWISNYNFQFYLNDSKIDIASPDEDASSMRYTFTYNNIYFLNREKGKLLIYDLGLSLNDADGSNYKYKRLDAAINYLLPITLWDLTISSKIAYYHSMYDSSDDRQDNNLSVNFTAIRSINEWLSWNMSVGYTDNQSSVSTKDYDKFIVGSNINGKWNF